MAADGLRTAGRLTRSAPITIILVGGASILLTIGWPGNHHRNRWTPRPKNPLHHAPALRKTLHLRVEEGPLGPSMMQHVTCNFCGADSAQVVHTLTDIRLRLPGEFTLVRCRVCGLLYLNPRPDRAELARHYPDSYHPFIGAIADQPSAFRRWALRYGVQRRCRAIMHRQSHGCLLDVGCATGVFLDEMRQHGRWQVQGVEPVATAAEYARQRFGLHIFQGTLLEAGFPDGSFDVVTMWDVLEHVDDPAAHLREIWRILRPGGWVALKVPDPSSIEARLFGRWWVGYEAPQHLFGFSAQVLARQLRRSGFDEIARAQLGSDYSAFMDSLSAWLEAQQRARLARVAQRLARSAAARVASAPLLFPLRRLGFGSSVVFFARKPS